MNGRLLACLALGGSLFGCTSWQVAEVAPAEIVSPEAGQRVRVTRTDGTQVVLEHARLTASGVSGRWERTPVVIPAAEIRKLALRRDSPSRTVALIAGLVGAVGAAGAVAVGGGEPVSNLR